MNHTDTCMKRLIEMSCEYEKFKAAYPNHCRRCNATGWQRSTDIVECWGAQTTMSIDSWCDWCVGSGVCPLCGQVLDCPEDADIIVCRCGYDSETNCSGGPEPPDEFDHCICDIGRRDI